METMHAAGRRRLPPVPRISGELAGPARTITVPPIELPAAASPSPDSAETERFTLPPATGEQETQGPQVPEPNVAREMSTDTADTAAPAEPASTDPATSRAAAGSPEAATEQIGPELDAAQRFVTRLRAAAADFAEAAGATSAVVREAVPPARHRRSRCSVVLRYPDGSEADLTFLGPAGAAPGSPSRHGFDRQIRRWLGSGQRGDGAWLVPDPDARDGVAVDISAWLTAG
jgi:hypothetical protein